MKKQTLLVGFVLALVSVLVVSTGALAPNPAVAEKGGIPGPPDGKGGGGGAPDYGDLIILYRDAFGVPIPSEVVPVTDPETGQWVEGGLCWQPIAFEPLTCGTEPIPIDTASGEYLVPVDQYNCGVDPAYAACTQEVDFGRINEARSPEDVFLSQLEDVVTKLAIADSRSLDPAGRLVASTCPAQEVTTSTVDSPLQNLAIYRQLILEGTIGTDLPEGADILDTAARGLGAASDKSGGVNVDMVAYLNQIMGLSDPLTSTILDPKICKTYREEVQGVIQLVEKCFLDFDAYGYDRTTNFGELPDPAYIPAAGPVDGWFEYTVPLGTDPPTFGIVQGPILSAVFGDEPGFPDGNVGGFAQAADDTRAVINFMHTNPVPDGYETPVPCTPSEGTFVDVSISDVSGLQVPRQMVDGSEGREFTVTVANAGPAPASGTVTVTAIAETGGPITGSPWTFEFADVAAGAGESFTQFFSIDLGERTTINWEAVAASDEFDVNISNNTVNESTNVRVTRGGGGGGGGGH